MSFRILFLVTTGLLPGVSGAVGQNNYERVLVPVVANGVPGAYGTIWQTLFAGFNPTAELINVKLTPDEFCAVPPCLGPAQPNAPFGNEALTTPGPEGQFLFVEMPAGEALQFNLRIFDRAHISAAWGAEIPVVRERQFTSGTLHLLNVILDPLSRTTLRVYGLENRVGSVLVHAARVDRLPFEVADLIVTLHPTPQRAFGVFPSLGVVPELTVMLPSSWAQSRIRLEIAAPSDQKIWAFVSMTNNETQGVTISSPSH